MARLIKLCSLTLLVVTIAASAPLCTTGTYASYVALGVGGCSLGQETFSNFSIPSFANSLGVPTLTTSQILITPSSTGNNEVLAFSYETAAGAPLVISLSDNSQVFAFSFSYLAAIAPTFGLSSIQMDSAFSNTVPGSVSATKNVQSTGGGPVFTSAVSDGGVNNTSNTYNGPITSTLNGTGAFNGQDSISLQAQTGLVTDSGFTNSFVLSPVVTTGAPEPASCIMIGAGLLLIGAVTRRISNRHERMNG